MPYRTVPGLELALELAELLEHTHTRPVRAPFVAQGPGAGAGAGAGGEGAGGAGEGAGGEGAGAGAGAGGEGAGAGQGAGAGGEWTPPTREEYEAQQQRLQRAEAAAARQSRTAREQTRAQQQAAGQFEELYNGERQRVERITGVLGTQAVTSSVAEVAQRLGFRNPQLAHGLLSGNGGLAGVEAEVDLEGDEPKVTLPQSARTLIEQRLTRLAETEPYLLADARQRQLPGAGQNNGGQGGDGAAFMNAEIRRAAGRGR